MHDTAINYGELLGPNVIHRDSLFQFHTLYFFSIQPLVLSDQHATVGRDYVNKNVHFVRASERDNRMDILRTAAARLTAIMMRCRRRCQPIGIHAHIYTLTELLLYCMSVKTNCAGWRNTQRQTVKVTQVEICATDNDTFIEIVVRIGQ
jgi:hypothetical protein